MTENDVLLVQEARCLLQDYNAMTNGCSVSASMFVALDALAMKLAAARPFEQEAPRESMAEKMKRHAEAKAYAEADNRDTP